MLLKTRNPRSIRNSLILALSQFISHSNKTLYFQSTFDTQDILGLQLVVHFCISNIGNIKVNPMNSKLSRIVVFYQCHNFIKSVFGISLRKLTVNAWQDAYFWSFLTRVDGKADWGEPYLQRYLAVPTIPVIVSII